MSELGLLTVHMYKVDKQGYTVTRRQDAWLSFDNPCQAVAKLQENVIIFDGMVD